MDNEKKYCPFCKGEINAEAIRCIHCKQWLDGHQEEKPRKFLETLLLSWFLGMYGVHRFYTGYYAIGTIQLLTLGGCGIWSTIDFISICLNGYKDEKGHPLLQYSKGIGISILILQIIVLLLIILVVLLIFNIAAIMPPTEGCQ